VLSGLVEAETAALPLPEVFPVPVERRRQQRIPANEAAWCRVLNPLLEKVLKVQILDRSTDGLSVRAARSLLAGTLVQVRLEDSIVLGEVRYCVRAGDAFRVGIRIENSIPLLGSKLLNHRGVSPSQEQGDVGCRVGPEPVWPT
jgi:hypothetical protein